MKVVERKLPQYYDEVKKMINDKITVTNEDGQCCDKMLI